MELSEQLRSQLKKVGNLERRRREIQAELAKIKRGEEGTHPKHELQAERKKIEKRYEHFAGLALEEVPCGEFREVTIGDMRVSIRKVMNNGKVVNVKLKFKFKEQ